MLTIRPATLGDLEEFMAIERASFPTPWRREAMEDELRGRRVTVYLAAEVGGRIVGYAGMWCHSGEAHIMNVAVDPAHRRQGYGEALLLELLSRAAALRADLAYLEVRPSNLSAAALYRKLGFRPVGMRPNYYQDTGEDAVLMTLDDLQRRATASLAAYRQAWESRYGCRPVAP